MGERTGLPRAGKCPENDLVESYFRSSYKLRLRLMASVPITPTLFSYPRITCWRRDWLGWILKLPRNHSTGCQLSSQNWLPVMSHRRRPIRWRLKKEWMTDLVDLLLVNKMFLVGRWSLDGLWLVHWGYQGVKLPAWQMLQAQRRNICQMDFLGVLSFKVVTENRMWFCSPFFAVQMIFSVNAMLLMAVLLLGKIYYKVINYEHAILAYFSVQRNI